MAESWPSGLQDKLNETQFSYAFGKTTLTSTVDVGPAKKRNRYTKEIDALTCSILIEQDDYETFKTFYRTTLSSGVKTFLYDHPFTGVETEFRFVDEPSITPLGGPKLQINMVWEIMP